MVGIKRLVIFLLVVIICIYGGIVVNAIPLTGLSKEYISTRNVSDTGKQYYNRLVKAVNKTKDSTKMQRVWRIALSQTSTSSDGTIKPGYANYSSSMSSEESFKKYKWRGQKLLNNDSGTGNTEYTRWMFENILGKKYTGFGGNTDCDWCAIFVSWCLYHADFYKKLSDGKCDYTYYYALTADPRIVRGADTDGAKIENFNFNQAKVYYTPQMKSKLQSSVNVYEYRYRSDGVWKSNYVAAKNIKYRPGGIIFFTYDGGYTFSHVGIVLRYTARSGTLDYISGNDKGRVRRRVINVKNTENGVDAGLTIAAYAEY